MPLRRALRRGPGYGRVRARRPRALLALAAAIATAALLSAGVSDGALPTASLPAFGVTAGSGSLSTVAELG
ncbi:MAG: hypothetical protein QOD65_557, partial [Gaiellales bacterium]|nr:hypothetical protein [Gaiellales bacterium]